MEMEKMKQDKLTARKIQLGLWETESSQSCSSISSKDFSTLCCFSPNKIHAILLLLLLHKIYMQCICHFFIQKSFYMMCLPLFSQ